MAASRRPDVTGSQRSGHGMHPLAGVKPLANQGNQRVLDRASARQVQQHPIFILFDAGGDLEQREHDGPRLSARQGRALQAQVTELLVQDVSTGGGQRASEIGEEAGGGCTVEFQDQPSPA